MPQAQQEQLPPLGFPSILEFDQAAPGFPQIGIHWDSNSQEGLQVPAFNSAAPAGGPSLPGTNYPSGYYFSEARVLKEYSRILWIYRQFPGSWMYKDLIDEPTGIRSLVAIGYVPNLESNQGGIYTGPKVVSGKSFGGGILVTLSSGGGSYTGATTVSFTGGTSSVAAVAVPVITAGVITGLFFTVPGNYTVVPSGVVFTDTGGGTGAAGTVGFAGDLVVVEYPGYDGERTPVMVTIFSSTLVSQTQEGPFPVEGEYPIPPVLAVANTYQDIAEGIGINTGTGNWSWQWHADWEAEIGMGFRHFPKLIGTRQVNYFVGPPNLSALGITPTQLFAASGEFISIGGGQNANEDAWANDTASGTGEGAGASVRYKKTGIPPCLAGTGFPTSGSGGSFQAGYALIRPASTTWPPASGTIIEFEVEVMKLEKLYRLVLNTWTVPTPP